MLEQPMVGPDTWVHFSQTISTGTDASQMWLCGSTSDCSQQQASDPVLKYAERSCR